MKEFLKALVLIIIGGCIYISIEIGYRGYSHWTMFLVGGIAFYLIGCINEYIEWKMPLYKQMFIGCLIITTIEFVSGILFNIILKMNIWDYSNLPFNILGQICIPFSLIWYGLSLIGIVLDDYLRYILFKEEKPKYTLFREKGGIV